MQNVAQSPFVTVDLIKIPRLPETAHFVNKIAKIDTIDVMCKVRLTMLMIDD